MFDFLSLENRKYQRKCLVEFIFKYFNNINYPNKILAFIIKSIHFTFPFFFIFIFLSASLHYCILYYCVMLFFLLLYIYLNGCFVTHLEYKLYSKHFINIIDPYLALVGYPFNKHTRFYGSFVVAFIYFFIVSIIIYWRFYKKID